MIFLKLFVFVLRCNVPVNNFSVMSGLSHRLLGFNQYSRELMCLPQGHNTVTLVVIEPRTSPFRVRRSTTRPPASLLRSCVGLFIQGVNSLKKYLYSIYVKLSDVFIMHLIQVATQTDTTWIYIGLHIRPLFLQCFLNT